MGIRHLPAGASDEAVGCHLAPGDARGPAEVRPLDTRDSQPWTRHPLHVAEQQAHRCLAPRHAAARGVDSRAGAPAEHLRQRELSRRDRRRHRLRPVRHPLPPAQGHARARAAPAPAGTRQMGAARGPPARRGPQGARPWRELRQVRARPDLCRRGGRRHGRPHDRGDPRRPRVRGPRLRPDHQSRRPAQPDRGQRRADREPQHRRESDVQPQRGHEPRLGQLSDP